LTFSCKKNEQVVGTIPTICSIGTKDPASMLRGLWFCSKELCSVIVAVQKKVYCFNPR